MIARIFRFLAIAVAAHGLVVALFALVVAPRLGDDVPEPFASVALFTLYVPASFFALPLRPLLWNLGLIEAPGWFTWPKPLGYVLAYVIWAVGFLVLSLLANRLERRLVLPRWGRTVKVKFNKMDPDDIQLHIPKKDTTVSVGVEALGAGRFRLANFPIGACEWLTFGDVIEATTLPDGTLEFIRRVERSSFKTYEFILSKEFAESEPLSRVLAQVMELGGHWERVFTGVLLIAVPSSAEWDPTADINRASADWRS